MKENYKTETPKWMKRLVRARMKETGEKYTKTLRDIKAEQEKLKEASDE